MSPKIPKIDSHSGLDFISSIQTSWLVEGSQPTDPLIFLVLQTLTFTAPALGTTHMAHPSQHLLRCVSCMLIYMIWTSLTKVLLRDINWWLINYELWCPRVPSLLIMGRLISEFSRSLPITLQHYSSTLPNLLISWLHKYCKLSRHLPETNLRVYSVMKHKQYEAREGPRLCCGCRENVVLFMIIA